MRLPFRPLLRPISPAPTRILEQNKEWSVQRSRYMALESIAPIGDDPMVNLHLAAV